MKLSRNKKILIVLSVIFFLVRLPFLDQLFLLHDERDIVLSGLSVARTGHDLYGSFLPFTFSHINPDNPLFAIYFSVLAWLAIPFKTVFFARLPYVLVSTLFLYLVYRLLREFRQPEKIAILTASLFCFSPWIFHISRLAMDVTVAFVYILAGILFFLKRKKILAFALFFLACFSYQGFRLLVPFLAIYLEWFFYLKDRDGKTLRKSILIDGILVFLIFVSIFFIDAKITANRLDQLVFLNKTQLTPAVDLLRNSSIAPQIVRKIFSNKFTVSVDYIVSNFIMGHDPLYLFKTGDYSPINGNGVAGQFFLVFLLFFYIGVINLGKRLDKYGWYIVGLIVVGMIPALARGGSVTFSIRAILSGIGFAYIIAIGIEEFLVYTRGLKKTYRTAVFAVVFFVLGLNLIYFAYDYFTRRPVTVGELYNENERRLAEYLSTTDDGYTVYHAHARDAYFSYIFLSNKVNFARLSPAQPGAHEFVAGKTKFVQCQKSSDFLNKSRIVIHEACLSELEYAKLPQMRKIAKEIPYADISGKSAYFVIR